MGRYNFDEIIERKNTNSLKYDFAKERGLPEDVLPFWVADMDFKAPEEVRQKLIERSEHGIFGYTGIKQEYIKTVQDWFVRRFDFNFDRHDLVLTPGIVFAICSAIRSLTVEGDAVMIQTPVYYPFSQSVTNNNRVLVTNSLVYNEGKYTIDFEDFENKIRNNHVKLFILCNPHNPVGRVWTKEELTRLGDICLKYHVLVFSDEIHADFIYKGYTHTIFETIKPEFRDITITATAPSKTFNIAGLQISNLFVKNHDIRAKIKKEIEKTGYCEMNTMGVIACQAAYQYGESWLEELKVYLENNLKKIRQFLKDRLPQITLVEPEGTYLVWLDFSKLNLTSEQLQNLIVHKAKLWLDAGTMFGPEGEGFERINIATSWSKLEQALINLERAIKE
jgi:cystathionine beta-lyase